MLAHYFRRLAPVAVAITMFAACSDALPSDTVIESPVDIAPVVSTQTVEVDQAVRPPISGDVYVIETGQSIVSLAAIPATAHLGKSSIVAAHGAAGVSIRDTSGTVLWTIDTPATLVAHYQNQLVVFDQTDDGVTSLKRYRVGGFEPPVLVETVSPSPIAATTLQRTAIASLGPARIQGSDLIIGDKTVSVPTSITAIAAASYFPPLIAGQTLLIATIDGDIIIQPG